MENKELICICICKAHMAGQRDAGCLHPSWSNALAYYKTVENLYKEARDFAIKENLSMDQATKLSKILDKL